MQPAAKPLPWKRVWITGASTGIGAAIAQAMAVAGAEVAISARDAAALEVLAEASGGKLKPFPLDVTRAAEVASTFAAIENTLGPVDLVIAGAGLYRPVAPSAFSARDFQQMMNVNYMGVVNVLEACLPAMRSRQHGHVSWIASVAGYRGLPKAAAYGPTKAALINLAESLRCELEQEGLKVSVINPGFVKTPMTAQNDFPMPFLMEPDDAARAIIKGLARQKFEIAFPAAFVLILKTLRLLPYSAYFAGVRRFVLKQAS